jgi:threonine aldolase
VSARDADAVRNACSRSLAGAPAHGRRPREVLEQLTAAVGGVELDRYGAGGIVRTLEERVAELLGKEAAVFMPTGTMAQQVALRVHADRRGVRTVALHPTSHVELHEDKAYERLHGLEGLVVGRPTELLLAEDLTEVSVRVAALLVELPQRETGGQLPTWDELRELAAWARARGAALHLDGARLWEALPFYGRPAAEVAAAFDSVYVSFYKGLGALGGAALAGSAGFVAEARVWQARHGGRIFHFWPYALSAQVGLDAHLPRQGDYYRWVTEFAGALQGDERIAFRPDPPQSPLVHVHVRAEWDALLEAAIDVAGEHDVWVLGSRRPDGVPGTTSFELHAGESTLAVEPAEAAALLRDAVARAAG